jgi:DNA-binding MarR family transcriptional regulator
MLLVLKETGPQSLSELASRMWLDHPTASRLAHGLEDRGFLTVERHPQQGRRVSIALRPDRTEELEALAHMAEAFREELEAGISAEQKTVFRGVMEVLLRNLAAIQARQRPGMGT